MRRFYLSLILFAASLVGLHANDQINLAGTWNFAIDPLDVGLEEKWYETTFKEIIQLPGSMTTNAKGNDITIDTKWTATNWSDSSWHKRPEFEKYRQPDNLKFSFWLTPDKEYVGAAWYQKKVNIPAKWILQDVYLHLERCHWETTLWVNGSKVGTDNSLSVPHVYRLTGLLQRGNNVITLRIDNRIEDINPGLDAHSISDNTQTNWNGVIGEIYLAAKPQIHISHLNVFLDIQNVTANVHVKVSNNTDKEVRKKIIFKTKNYNIANVHLVKDVSKTVLLNKGENHFNVKIPLGNSVQLWSEHNPALYNLDVSVDGVKNSALVTTFGMREFRADGSRFVINNKPVFLRGTLECAIFPLTGFPPTDVHSWKKIMKQVQNFGLNHIRFHSWCPPKAAFIAADESGIYLQVEPGTWATVGDGEAIDQFIFDESERIVNEYGNHPSFCLMAASNEPHGKNRNHYLSGFLNHWKNKDNRRVYTSGAGWPQLPENDYHNIQPPRIQQWNAGLKSSINAEKPQSVSDYSKIIQNLRIPVVSHEIGQWCAFPNFDEIHKYRGVLKPKNFEMFREDLSDRKMGHLAKKFLMASGKLQVLCYKADIEAALRTKGMAGFQLLDLRDFPGQGTALVGVLDPFWEEKGYVTAAEYRNFCNKVVPLVRLPKMTFTNADTLIAYVELANFSGNTLKSKPLKWELIDKKMHVVKSGVFVSKDYPEGNGLPVGTITLPLKKLASPLQYRIRVSVPESDYVNSWDIWVYPEKVDDIAHDIYITNKLNEVAIQQLNEGKNVLLTLKRSDLKAEKGGSVELGFSTVFWNTSWTKNQAPHTLGILCDPEHPALSLFPTEYNSNWQWWEILKEGAAINTDDFPVDFKAIVQPIHTWFDNQRLALIFEANVLNGKLMVVGTDLHSDLDKRIVARQLKYSLVNYMQSNSFNPKNILSQKDIESLMKNNK